VAYSRVRVHRKPRACSHGVANQMNVAQSHRQRVVKCDRYNAMLALTRQPSLAPYGCHRTSPGFASNTPPMSHLPPASHAKRLWDIPQQTKEWEQLILHSTAWWQATSRGASPRLAIKISRRATGRTTKRSRTRLHPQHLPPHSRPGIYCRQNNRTTAFVQNTTQQYCICVCTPTHLT